MEALDPERAEDKIVHRGHGFAHQSLIPIALRKPEAAVALRIVRPQAKANVPDRLAITAVQHQHPVIDLLARGDLLQLSPDEGLRAVLRIWPGNHRREMLDDVPVVEMALDRRRIG